VVEEAFREAQSHQPVKKSALLKYDDSNQPPIVTGDRAALKHAFLEVFLNALQANPNDPKIAVRLKAESGQAGKGRRWAQVEVQDNGEGFSSEALNKVPSPFFTTRAVGLGLGLTVTRKIIETHHGRMEIVNPTNNRHGLVRIFLPQSIT
jgi:nitrogen fixation/metabolism regulation signal transduction histidine kinase